MEIRRFAVSIFLMPLMILGSSLLADDLEFEKVPFGTIPNYSFVKVNVRPGVSQGFLLIDRKDAKASVILFVGGGGFLGLGPSGFRSQTNFLMRTRDLFAAQRLRVAIVDIPSDRLDLNFFRNTTEHAEDIAGVIRFLRRRSGAPVWVVGTSRGTVSAANAAAQLTGKHSPDGLVLTSTLLQPGGSGRPTVFDTALNQITIPTLIVHHEEDACFVTLFSDLPPLVDALSNTRTLEVKSFIGGGPFLSDECAPFHFHGFIGLEAEVVSSIGDFVHANSRGHKRRK